jgi:hypothetical protein
MLTKCSEFIPVGEHNFDQDNVTTKAVSYQVWNPIKVEFVDILGDIQCSHSALPHIILTKYINTEADEVGA